MRIDHLSVADAYTGVRSGPDGLSSVEAARRFAEYGPNEVEPVRRERLVRRFLRSFTHFFAVILWVAAALALVAGLQEPGQGMLILSGAIVGVIGINGGFSFWQEYRAERALEALQRLLPQRVKLKRGGSTASTPAAGLVPGDVVFLEAGDKVPADCRVVEAFALRVDNSTVTGESVPHSRNAAASDDPDLLHSGNVLLAGTSVVSGEATALVFATGAHTAFGQIAHLTQSMGEPQSPLQKEVARLSRLVALLALSLGVMFFFIGRAIGLPFWDNFVFAIGIIVANVPEGLLPTLTLALAMGSQRMAGRNALVRHLPAVETLGAATVICTDKTGTLTENHLTARRVWLDGREISTSDLEQLHLLAVAHQRFFQIARQSHNLKAMVEGGRRKWLGDPLEVALVELAEEVTPGAVDDPPVDEIPFDSRRRRMSTVHQTAEGPLLYLKGAPEAVLPLCQRLELGRGPAPLDPLWRERIKAAQESMAQDGLRVLALAWKQATEEQDRGQWETQLTLAGLIALEDPPRAEVPAAVARCRDAGIRVIMVTGDHAHTALAVARRIGLVTSDAPLVISGDQLQRLANSQLQLALDAPEVLFARVAADQKMRIVATLKRKNEIVAVTGDGVNDAPALRKADVGIAMGRCGSDVARESADLILLDDNFATIVAAIEEGRAVYANIRKFLTYILTSNIPELVPYLAFVLFQIPLALTIIQILAVDLGTDMLPALALGSEPPDPDTMRQPPRPRTGRLLSFGLMARAYLWLGPLQSAAAMSAFFFILHRGGWRYGHPLATDALLYLQATTACLTAIIVMQIVNVFLCRSPDESALHLRLFRNPLIPIGIAVELGLILVIAYTPWGNTVFGTAPIPPSAWLFMVPFALALFLLEEIRKWMVRRSIARVAPLATRSSR